MIKRIVKMEFEPARLEDFLALFTETCEQIRAFPGCSHLELWQDDQQPARLFTYSFWESAEALEQYRQSDLFKTTWAQTKKWFADRPEAWSIRVYREV
jgi:quinol monooxygenase YgiN